jgi:hypothetical protein
MSAYDRRTGRCECCGLERPTVPYGEADSSGHLWTYHTCAECQAGCSSDEEGRPAHMLPGWPGTPETFESYRVRRLVGR